jgi:hypothetical protein
MCWGALIAQTPRPSTRLASLRPWPRPHLAAAKLVELRSSVDLVAMPHQPLDRPVASLTNPGLRDVRCAHIAPPRAVLGSPRCGCRGDLGVASFGGWPLRPALAPLARLAQPVARRTLAPRKARSASGTKKLPPSPSRLCVSVRSLSHANDQESHPLPDPAAARRCGGRRPVIRC